VRSGERIENADLIKVQTIQITTEFHQHFHQISKLFTDQLTLDNLPRPQLVRRRSSTLHPSSLLSRRIIFPPVCFTQRTGVDVPPLEHRRLGHGRHTAHAGDHPPFRAVSFIICADFSRHFQLRSRLEKIKHDDVMIAKETVDHLSTMELRAACSERG
jgi:hypothetical protein